MSQVERFFRQCRMLLRHCCRFWQQCRTKFRPFDKDKTNWTCSICFDFVERTKFRLTLVPFVATKSSIASTLLLVWTGLKWANTVHTATPHADSQTLLVSTALAVCAGRRCHLTSAIIFALKLVTVTGIAQEERLVTHTHTHTHTVYDQTTTTGGEVRVCGGRQQSSTKLTALSPWTTHYKFTRRKEILTNTVAASKLIWKGRRTHFGAKAAEIVYPASTFQQCPHFTSTANITGWTQNHRLLPSLSDVFTYDTTSSTDYAIHWNYTGYRHQLQPRLNETVNNRIRILARLSA